MSLIIQKYGGTSVANTELIKNVARRILKTQRDGHKVVAVVSAMGKTTDTLVGLAEQITDHPLDREMDMLLSSGETVSMSLLSMAINDLGGQAISFNGAQCGIITESVHQSARIVRIEANRVKEELDRGGIVIVAGFQGVTPEVEITTLGRGGSDTTAVALAHTLGADECQILTDVDGVYTADPRIVPEARKLDRISTDEMLEFASAGAGILKDRSVEFAGKYGVVLHVRSSFHEEPGTLVLQEEKMLEEALIRGVAHTINEAKVMITGLSDQVGLASHLIKPLADENITVDLIVLASGQNNTMDMSFTVPHEDLQNAVEILSQNGNNLDSGSVSFDGGIATVSVIGVGMKSHAEVASKMFEALAEAGINIEMVSTSQIKVTCVIRETDVENAVVALHRAFELDKKVVKSPESAAEAVLV